MDPEPPVSLSQNSSSLSACSPHRTVPQITNDGMAYVPSFFPGAKSSKSSLDAKAYADGKVIHFGPGQEKHLPHELQHVVQQKQGNAQYKATHKYPIQSAF